MNNDLIFDLGFHVGQDSEFYLKKGFKVVGVEANPILCKQAYNAFSSFIDSHVLQIINKAMAQDNSIIEFYVHPDHSDWSSCYVEYIKTQKDNLEQKLVSGITLDELVELYGVPRYIKTDVEGADTLVSEQLIALKEKPKFVSFEVGRTSYIDIFTNLKKAGYTKFQLINQLKYDNLFLKNISNEGKTIDFEFQFGSSGLFGEDLPKNSWINMDELFLRYTKYCDLRNIDQENLSMGWIDVHAML